MHSQRRSPMQFVPSTPNVYTSDAYSGAGDDLNAVVPDIYADNPDINPHRNWNYQESLVGVVPHTPVPRQPTSQVWLHDRFIPPSPYPLSQSPAIFKDRSRGVGSTPRISCIKSRYKDELLQEVPCTPQCMKLAPYSNRSIEATPRNQTSYFIDNIATPSHHINGTSSQAVGIATPNRRQNRILYPSQNSPEIRPLQLFDGEEIFL